MMNPQFHATAIGDMFVYKSSSGSTWYKIVLGAAGVDGLRILDFSSTVVPNYFVREFSYLRFPVDEWEKV